jgi:protocatechuate 3,4-dioxygenase beta subunit
MTIVLSYPVARGTSLPMTRTSNGSISPGFDRRGFLRLAAGSMGSMFALGCTTSSESGPVPMPGGGGKADGVEFDDNGVCISGTTGDDALGPYWTNNVRQTNMLASPTEKGQRLLLMGRVLARDCITPIPGALVVAWQADDDGLYDYNHAGLNQGSSQGTLSTSQTRLRGYVPSSTAGTFSFDTIVPSEYPLNLLDPATSAYRAPHIHFAVFWNDRFGNRHQLVTQMYFAPTALMKTIVPTIDELNAEDGGASTAEASRFITVDGSSSTQWHGQFDIVLDVAPSLVG